MGAAEFPSFAELEVAVVGDLIADHYLFAEPQRLSREAPVMVLSHRREAFGAGGAANVARNLAALGARVSLLGIAGRDASGRELLRSLEQDGVDVRGVELVTGAGTPTKTRVLAAEPRRSLQQVLRIDREPTAPHEREAVARLTERATACAGRVDALVLSDYEYGAVSTALAPAVAAIAQRERPCVLDPRRQIDGFGGLTALTPNQGELALFAGVRVEDLDREAELARAAAAVLARTGARWLLVTRGNRGMALFGAGLDPAGERVDASGSGEITDVCGAGDTAAAVFTLALAAGDDPVRAMRLANAASGVVVMEHGAASCSPEQLARALGAENAPPGAQGEEEPAAGLSAPPAGEEPE